MGNEKEVCRSLRHKFSTTGWALLLYYGIMTSAVMAISYFDVLFRLLSSGADSMDAMYEALDSITQNGWGYLISIAIGGVLLLLWKKKDFCFREIWRSEKPMRPGAFFSLFAIFFGIQALVQVMSALIEQLFNLFGTSMMDGMEQVSTTGDTFSMFLYVAILAPITEEILFRGAILRTLQPYGKKFAILTSAFLFAIFHGNFIQTPYAFLIGLVLGYVTVEYSMGWAIFLHLFNNLVLVDMMDRLSAVLPTAVGSLLTLTFIWGCAAAALVILIVKWRQVWQYLTEKKMHPWCVKSFFTSPGVLVSSAIMLGNILFSLLVEIFF